MSIMHSCVMKSYFGLSVKNCAQEKFISSKSEKFNQDFPTQH